MSTYCHQKITVFGTPEHLKALVPGYSTGNLSINFEAEAKNAQPFNLQEMTDKYPQLIFVMTESIETWVVTRSIAQYGETFTIGKWEDNIPGVGYPMPDESHETFCKQIRHQQSHKQKN